MVAISFMLSPVTHAEQSESWLSRKKVWASIYIINSKQKVFLICHPSKFCSEKFNFSIEALRYRRFSRNLPRTMVISKKNRHHQNHRQIPFCFWSKWLGLFDC